MGVLARIADAGLTEKLEGTLRRFTRDADIIRLLRETIDTHGIRSPELLRRVGDMTRAGVLKPRLFPKLCEVHDALESKHPNRREPSGPPARADLQEKRGPGDPVLLRLGTDYPVPPAMLYPREHTAARRIFDYLLANQVTRLELVEAGRKLGWSPESAKLWWARLQSPQMVRSGWLLDIHAITKRGQVIQLAPNWDWREGKPIK